MVPTFRPRPISSGINFSIKVVFPDPEFPTTETKGGNDFLFDISIIQAL
jgi:hypothetical protein